MIVNTNQNATTFDEALHALKYSAIAKQVVVEQEPVKEVIKRPPRVRSHRLVSMALTQTPRGKSRATIGWATPGLLLFTFITQKMLPMFKIV